MKGLAENDIYTIYEDKAQNIWIGLQGLEHIAMTGKHLRCLRRQTEVI
ncbi:MAG: hypothetical protein IPH31_17615 [Lewinellaceae bacterium]|nr:hypothetical protein [Lewinellaceae bacterium]